MAESIFFDLNKKEAGRVDLRDDIFNIKPNPYLIQNAVKTDQTNRRQGNASTKTRAEVSGGGRKPYKQKGTGRARRGTSRSPICVGGGIVFGPKPRNYKIKMNKKAGLLALKSAISQKKIDEKLLIVERFELADKKTKNLIGILENFGIKSAVIVDRENENLSLSCRNLKNVKVMVPERINVYDVLKYEHLILTKKSLDEFNEIYK